MKTKKTQIPKPLLAAYKDIQTHYEMYSRYVPSELRHFYETQTGDSADNLEHKELLFGILASRFGAENVRNSFAHFKRSF